jgi:hypothetical protein
MIDRQVRHLDTAVPCGRRRRPRLRPSRRVPSSLGAADLVVAYAEASAPGGDHGVPRELVQWTAVRADTGEVCDLIVRPGGAAPSARHLEHMGLTPEDLAGGLPLDEARARFAAFASRGAAVCAWTANTFAWAAPLLAFGAPRVVLKVAYCNLRNRAANELERVLDREGIAAMPLPCRGRAAVRLGNALAVARWLRTRRDEIGGLVPRATRDP